MVETVILLSVLGASCAQAESLEDAEASVESGIVAYVGDEVITRQ